MAEMQETNDPVLYEQLKDQCHRMVLACKRRNRDVTAVDQTANAANGQKTDANKQAPGTAPGKPGKSRKLGSSLLQNPQDDEPDLPSGKEIANEML